MFKTKVADSCCGFRVFFFALSCLYFLPITQAQTRETYYARKNSFGVLVQYSNDSSHILLGVAEQRKLLNIGVSYSRRLLLNRVVNFQYDGELLPVALESDPVARVVFHETQPITVTYTQIERPVGACVSASGSYEYQYPGMTFAGTYVQTCDRQWTVGQAMSPAGLQANFYPGKKYQFYLTGHGGYMYSTQQIPTDYAGSFNFTFDFGAGVELYRSHSRSIRAGYRYHHISNNDSATLNPGIDNGVISVSYVFGR